MAILQKGNLTIYPMNFIKDKPDLDMRLKLKMVHITGSILNLKV